jgi:hypothetical protein
MKTSRAAEAGRMSFLSGKRMMKNTPGDPAVGIDVHSETGCNRRASIPDVMAEFGGWINTE